MMSFGVYLFEFKTEMERDREEVGMKIHSTSIIDKYPANLSRYLSAYG